ncbi:uncharacterized protein LOC114753845 [Neltuma alba]|uniref:uncharacterized protein LOC114753845 n=1 Tax=Neltuma alba TaxID=207710 RepID=UPI0010A2BE41|nr:uncharacterized protein LOC114753845 [Prosopis alba]
MTTADQDRNGSSNYHNLEIQKLLKKLNRPPVKSIKMRPSFHPEKSMLEKSEVSAKLQPVAQLWKQSGSCPEETIPIRRIGKEDILRAKSIQQFGKKNLKNIPQHGSFETQSKHQFAAVYVKGDKYYGGMATMNVWNPRVQEHSEFSDSQISILNDNIGEGYNSIQADWQDGSGENARGCYDLLCSGFVQVNHQVSLHRVITFYICGFQVSASQYIALHSFKSGEISKGKEMPQFIRNIVCVLSINWHGLSSSLDAFTGSLPIFLGVAAADTRALAPSQYAGSGFAPLGLVKYSRGMASDTQSLGHM